jgi:outer membrane immunogenic protein
LLAGVELDVESTNQRSTLKATCPGVICNPAITDFDAPVTAGMEQRLEWFSTLRGRLGAIVNPDTMAYVTGGLAVGRISTVGTLAGSSLTLTPTVDNAGNPILDANGNPIIASAVGPVTNAIVESTTKAGWSVGGGVEQHLGAKPQWEFPRLCRGGSKSLTYPAVDTVGPSTKLRIVSSQAHEEEFHRWMTMKV